MKEKISYVLLSFRVEFSNTRIWSRTYGWVFAGCKIGLVVFGTRFMLNEMQGY